MTKIIYHPHYNISFLGIEKLHPFDSKKYGRAYKTLKNRLGRRFTDHVIKPDRPVRRNELLQVHSPSYLTQLQSAQTVAQVLEIPQLRHLPGHVVDRFMLKRMRWATRGSVLAAQTAFTSGLAINLAGGYHHAKPDSGEGFCAYSDIALAVKTARKEGMLGAGETAVYIDLDAHQGNGVCHCFLDDERVQIFDMYNQDIYPVDDVEARQRINWDLPLSSQCPTEAYLDLLQNELPAFLSSLAETGQTVGFAIYNAGTDVYEEDSLGQLGLSEAGILKRDLFVLDLLREKNIPTVMLLSGGYTRQSYQLVANTVEQILKA